MSSLFQSSRLMKKEVVLVLISARYLLVLGELVNQSARWWQKNMNLRFISEKDRWGDKRERVHVNVNRRNTRMLTEKIILLLIQNEMYEVFTGASNQKVREHDRWRKNKMILPLIQKDRWIVYRGVSKSKEDMNDEMRRWFCIWFLKGIDDEVFRGLSKSKKVRYWWKEMVLPLIPERLITRSIRKSKYTSDVWRRWFVSDIRKIDESREKG